MRHSSLNLTVRTKTARKSAGRRFTVEMDADRFERLAAGLGLFSKGFLESLKRSEQEAIDGKLIKLGSLKELHTP